MEEKKKRNHPAYKSMFKGIERRVNYLTWIAAIGWILFTLTAVAGVCYWIVKY